MEGECMKRNTQDLTKGSIVYESKSSKKERFFN